jgi:hypothetical protein
VAQILCCCHAVAAVYRCFRPRCWCLRCLRGDCCREANRAKAANCLNAVGPNWSTSKDHHIRVCRDASKQSILNTESRNRQHELGKCSNCKDYAADAVNNARFNRRFSCGFSGPRWNMNSDDHFKWCIAEWDTNVIALGERLPGISYTASKEDQARKSSLEECRRKISDDQIVACTNYSNKASAQAVDSFIKKCGHEGPRWNMDVDAHFAFCVEGFRTDPEGRAIKQAMQSEEEARDAGNAHCAVAGPSKPGMLVPESSTGPSPFGGKKGIQRAKISPQLNVSGDNAVRRSTAKSPLRPTARKHKTPSSVARVGGGFDKSKQSPNAMDRMLQSDLPQHSSAPAAARPPAPRAAPSISRSEVPSGSPNSGGFSSTGTGGASGAFRR